MTPPKEKEPKKPRAKSSSAAKPTRKKRTVTFEAVAAEPVHSLETNGTGPVELVVDSSGPASLPSYETIRIRAYELYLARGGEHGHDLEDWLMAENEFKTPR